MVQGALPSQPMRTVTLPIGCAGLSLAERQVPVAFGQAQARVDAIDLNLVAPVESAILQIFFYLEFKKPLGGADKYLGSGKTLGLAVVSRAQVAEPEQNG